MRRNRRAFLQNTFALAAAQAVSGVTDAQAPAKPTPWKPKPYRRITTEEAWTTPEIAAASSAGAIGGTVTPYRKAINDRLLDIGEGRLKIMDEYGISMQVLSSNGPSLQNLKPDLAQPLTIEFNDRMAQAIRKHPTRFAGLAGVAPQNPEAAAKEIDRALGKLKLNGAFIASHTNGEYLDLPKYTPIFEVLVQHDAPLYLHPREMLAGVPAVMKVPGFTVGWGYSTDASIHVIRLMAGGVFDRFPKLRMVIGHMGEALPFWIDRLDNRYQWEFNMTGKPKPMKRLPSEYLRDHFHITTSGMNYWAQLKMTIEVMGIDRLMFAVDYPQEEHRPAVETIDNAPLSEEDRAKFYYRNAERVFGIKT
jgi:5-carboxyvanillate decarboxylase